MNITYLAQATSFSNYTAGFSRAASSSISSWSGVILATSLGALAGMGLYRWSQNDSSSQAPKDKNFEAVKARVINAYSYVFGGLALTATSAAVAHVSGLSRHILANSYFCVPVIVIGSMAALVTTMLTSKENTKVRHIALAIFNIGMGLTFSPLGFAPGSVIAQASFITMGIGGLLTFMAYKAPNKEFLKWEGPLMTALTTLSIASFVAVFFPGTAFAYGMDRASLYGGLLIFSGLFLSSTHQLLDKAETQSKKEFDPINASMNIYLDTLNIFVRIFRIVAENQKKEQKDY